MTTPKHSPEPWTNDDTEHDAPWPLLDAEDRAVATAGKEDRRRIVACVNACQGLPTEALESGALAKALDALVWRDRGDVWECRGCKSLEKGLHFPGCELEPIIRGLGREP